MIPSNLQHWLNALHIMCLFVRCGVSRPTALRIARCWEHVMHPLLYSRLETLKPVRIRAHA